MEIKEDITAEKYFRPTTKGLTTNFIKKLLMEVENLKLNSILDIGCGTGYISQQLKNHSSFCVGCDFDKARIKFAKDLGICVVLGDGKNLPFRSSSFDGVVAIELLEHVQNPEDILKEIKRVSKGSVLITVPNEPLHRIMNFLRNRDVGHVQHFNKKSLQSLLSEYFSGIKIKTNTLFWIQAICHFALATRNKESP